MSNKSKPKQDRAPVTRGRDKRRSRPVFGDFQRVDIDFAKLGETCGLTFLGEESEKLRQRLQDAANAYYAWTRPGLETPPAAGKVKIALERIAKACESLVPLLDTYARREPAPDAEAVRLAYPSSGYFGWVEEGQLAAFLRSFGAQARNAAREAAKRGRPESQELDQLILAAHQVYVEAGGKGRGCTANPAEADGYSGAFFRLMKEIIYQTERRVMGSGLGKAITKLLPGRN